MGRLTQLGGERAWYLEAESVVGRSPHCGMRLAPQYVSAQHASLRWNGSSWELKDLGSHNGTWLEGATIEVGRAYSLSTGARLGFGHPSETWILDDDTAPEVMVVELGEGEQRVAKHAILGIPTDDTPSATVYKTAAGLWCLECEDQRPITLANGSHFDVAGRAYRFCCPEITAATITSDTHLQRAEVALHFRVSRDEEYVELSAELGDRELKLGARSHNHLLLTLARARIKDTQSGEPDTACGWLYKEDLVSGIEMPQRVDNDIFRIRQHFARFLPHVTADVVERRFRTRQVRIGISQLRITTL